MRASGLGSHQFHRPNSFMAAGTSTSRTIVASIAIATALASPICWRLGTPALTNDRKTATMMSAALVIVAALVARPCATARVLSPLIAYRSRMRVSMNTS